MIRFSNASIKIAAAEGEKADSNERKVTIVGTPEAQWKVRVDVEFLFTPRNFIVGWTLT